MSYEVANKFWMARKEYPKYPNVNERRLIDVNFIINNIEAPESIIDLGCGTGYLLTVLRDLTNIKDFYGYDISDGLLNRLKSRWGNVEGLHTKQCDFTRLKNLPNTDLTITMGMFPYIFDFQDLHDIVARIKSKKFIVRTPCTLNDEAEYVNTYSEDLGDYYSSVYRTTQAYFDVLLYYFDDVRMVKAYPDEIESKYGTKQFFFVCERRNK